MTKEHKGTIHYWLCRPCEEGLGYYIVGNHRDPPKLGTLFSTSYVVKREGSEIETRNSRYTLGKESKDVQ